MNYCLSDSYGLYKCGLTVQILAHGGKHGWNASKMFTLQKSSYDMLHPAWPLGQRHRRALEQDPVKC